MKPHTIIDLTHTTTTDMSLFPGTVMPEIEEIATIENNSFSEHLVAITTHTGTHIDAPAHILPRGKALYEYEVSEFTGKGICIDCTGVQKITPDILRDSLTVNSIMPEFILLYTGWAGKWNTENYLKKHPELTSEAARFISANPVKGVGIDTLSIETIHSRKWPVHNILFNSNLLIIENLKNLEKLVNQQFTLMCFPLKINCKDAAPARVIAIKEH